MTAQSYLKSLTTEELLCRKTRRHDYDPDGYFKLIRWPSGQFKSALCRWLVCRRCRTNRIDFLRPVFTEDGEKPEATEDGEPRYGVWYQFYVWPDTYQYDGDVDETGALSKAIDPELLGDELMSRTRTVKRIPAEIKAFMEKVGLEL